MTDKIPLYIRRDVKKLYKFWEKIFNEEYNSLKSAFGDSYSKENGRQFLEVDGDIPEIVKFGRKYLEIECKTTDKLRAYAEKIGFQNYNSTMNKGPNVSSWKRDGWIVSIPDNPESVKCIMVEKDVSEK